jgi:hypothetical protein
VSHLEAPECGLRLLKLTKESIIHPHHHHNTTQTYLILEGIAKATVGDKTTDLKRHQILRVPVDAVHSIRTGNQALVLSIFISPLEASYLHCPSQGSSLCSLGSSNPIGVVISASTNRHNVQLQAPTSYASQPTKELLHKDLLLMPRVLRNQNLGMKLASGRGSEAIRSNVRAYAAVDVVNAAVNIGSI